MRSRLALAALLAGFAFAAPASADDDASKRAAREFSDGRASFDAKRYEESARHFETAASFVPHGAALYSAGLAWSKAGHAERAADAFAQALVVGGLGDERAARAADLLSDLEKRLGTVVIAGPETTRASLDDGAPRTGASIALHGIAGHHVVTIGGTGREIDLETGKRITITLDRAAPAPTPVEAAPPDTTPRDVPSSPYETPKGAPEKRTLAFVLMGGGAVALGTAAVTAIVGSGIASDYKAHPTLDDYNSAKTLETVTNVALIGGTVLAVLGVALYLWPTDDHAKSASVSISPRGMYLRGDF